MNTSAIREQLHNYLEVADDKKVKAIYTMMEDAIKDATIEYSEELKNELDQRLSAYQNGEETVSPKEMNTRLQRIRNRTK